MSLIANYLKTHISIIMSSLAFLISSITLWLNFFMPPKIKCAFGYLIFKKLQPNVGTRILEQFLVSRFSLRNLGTQPGMIQGIRFCFIVNHKKKFAYPLGEVPLQYIEDIKSHDEKFRENGCPFAELLLAKDETWKNTYTFGIKPNQIENYANLNGDGQFQIQVFYSRYCAAKWYTVKKKKYKIHAPCVFDSKSNGTFNIL